ncbi:MAG: cytochrome c oxidase subunit II [Actinobacteria bacterium]|nr:cytochrome c oxidase subunit II [Actinomycetota bacterium]
MRARRAGRLAGRAAMLAGVLAATAGCTSNAFTRLGMPIPVTRQGHAVLTLWQGSWVAAFAVGIVVWGLILWAVIFHRKRSDAIPHQVRYNLPIEMLYTVVPFIMVGVLFFFTARDENYLNKLPARPDVVVKVTGYQWSWQFQYPQYRVPGSTTGDVTMNGEMWSPTQGNRQLPVLEIPTNRTVRFDLFSTDVIHAFWIIPFEFKRDVIPGHPNHFEVTPTRTLYGGPDSIGHCTELCGLYHSRMLFRVRIVTPAQFSQWIHAQQAAQTKAAGGTQ